jgi:hypothetical protein
LEPKAAKIRFEASFSERLSEFSAFGPKIQDSFGAGLIFCFFFIKKKESCKKSVFIITSLSISYRKPVCKYSKKSNIILKFLQWKLLASLPLFRKTVTQAV